eukprot:GHVS01050229.1.p1 GENE.GHVS01050229.1~~GHVS01050229.1.p1  ORF type:complete len:204 (+),score=26.60 GHVS01050229.1:54-614(+)
MIPTIQPDMTPGGGNERMLNDGSTNVENGLIHVENGHTDVDNGDADVENGDTDVENGGTDVEKGDTEVYVFVDTRRTSWRLLDIVNATCSCGGSRYSLQIINLANDDLAGKLRKSNEADSKVTHAPIVIVAADKEQNVSTVMQQAVDVFATKFVFGCIHLKKGNRFSIATRSKMAFGDMFTKEEMR